MHYKKIVIVGTSCSGKTTLGKKIHTLCQIPFLDLDEAYWLPNWVGRSDDEVFSDIQIFVKNPSWVIAGNYKRFGKYIWPQADLIIWIDRPLYVLFYRGLKRGLLNIWNKTSICNGNYETIWNLLGPKSILWYIVKVYNKQKVRYQTFEKHLLKADFIHLKSDDEMTLFLKQHLET